MAHPKHKRCVFVIGMHRSGTSAIARLLGLGGSDLGDDDQLGLAARDNETGFWEAHEIRALDDEILDQLGGSWSAPPLPASGWEDSEALEPLRLRAVEIMDRLWPASTRPTPPARGGRAEKKAPAGSTPALCVAKDPRVSLTLPFWRSLIQRIDSVVCVRNPLAVARSLHVRDGLPLRSGIDLWLEYTLAALRNVDPARATLIHYDEVLEDWTVPYARLRRRLGARTLAPVDRIRAEVETFLRSDLRHHGATDDELAGCADARFAAIALYDRIRTTKPAETGSLASLQTFARATEADFYDETRQALERVPVGGEASVLMELDRELAGGRTDSDRTPPIASLRSALIEGQQREERLRTLVASEREHARRTQSEISRELVEARSQRDAAMLRAEAAATEKRTGLERLRAFERQVEGLRSQLESARAERKAQALVLGERDATASRRIEVLEGELLIARNERDLAEADALEVTSERDRVRREIEQAGRDNESLIQQVADERVLVAKTEEQREGLVARLHEADVRIGTLREEIRLAREQGDDMRSRHEEQIQGFRSQRETEQSQWQSLFASEQERHRANTDDFIERISTEYEAQVAKFRDSAGELSNRADGLKRSLLDREGRIAALQATQRLRQVEAEERARVLTETSDQLSAAVTEYESQRSRNDALAQELRSSVDELGQLRAQTRDFLGQKNDMTIELRALRLDHERTLERFAQLNDQLVAAEAKLSSFRRLVRETSWVASRRAFRVIPVPGRARDSLKKAFYGAYGRLAPRSERVRRFREAREVEGRRVRMQPVDASAFLSGPADGPQACDILIFSVIDWHFRHQRPQHIALELARQGYRVFYIATTFESDTQHYLPEPEFVAPGVSVVKLPCPLPHPVIYRDVPSREQLDALLTGLESLRRSFHIPTAISILNHPFWTPVVQALPANRLVYDCMDHHAGFANSGGEVLAQEHALLESASLVVCTAKLLEERAAPIARRTLRLPNAGEYEHFASIEQPPLIDRDRPVVGYFGAIAEWFDMPLVASAARALPEADFVLIGSTFGADIEPIEGIENVELLGEVPYGELPRYLAGIDVCLIPFKLNELTRSTNPVKVFEYLSAGKPVVSVRLPEVEPMAPVVLLADTPGEFVSQIQSALAQTSAEEEERRRAFARENSWKNRGELLSERLDALLPKVSIIVLTHNQLEFTAACLHSIEQLTDYPSWELIVVDNGSTDGTPGYLEDFAREREHVHVILGSENLGFAAGNNRGAEAATGGYLVFLNNDTYVTRGWIPDLLDHFEAEPTLGLLGPVTNNIGNEARIEVEYQDMDEMADIADLIKRENRHRRIELRAAAFFCTMIPKPIWDEVGGLDEGFEIGFFEDDDYANRIRKAGHRVMCAEDVFVHHHLSATFGMLDEQERKAIFEKNREYYESKWGPWIPHRARGDEKDQ